LISRRSNRLLRQASVAWLVLASLASSADAASVGASVGHGGVSVGASVGGVGIGASAGKSGAAVSASAATAGSSAGVSASAGASTGVSAGVSASSGGSAASAGVSAGQSTSAGLGASVGGTTASVGATGVSASVGASSGIGSVGPGASAPAGRDASVSSGLHGGVPAAQQSQGVTDAVDPSQSTDFEALQNVDPRDDSFYMQRGAGSLSADYRVHCVTEFCRTHLLGLPSRRTSPEKLARRYRTFDAVIVAAENGNADAEFTVAEVLAGGHGVPANLRRAAIWYSRAAEHGNTLAEARLEQMRASVAADQ